MKLKKVTALSDRVDLRIILADLNADQLSLEKLSEEQQKTAQRLFSAKKKGFFGLGGAQHDTWLLLSEHTAADTDTKEKLRLEAAQCSDQIVAYEAQTIGLEGSASFPLAAFMTFAEAFGLSAYAFNAYKSEKKRIYEPKNVEILHPALNKSLFDRLNATLNAVRYAKDLVNTPNIDLGVKELGKALKKQAEKLGISFTAFDLKKIKAHKMGGILGVNAGSPDDPAFYILEYKPEKPLNKRPLVLVGKGVVYDTGGYSLKPSSSMLSMKADMAGAAAASGALFHLAAQGHPVHTYCLIPATDNRVEKKAIVPDDVITISDGTTVEVQNTDAEGRLILADALAYAKKLDPELVIDFATLTGAAAYLTGHFSSAFLSTADDELNQHIMAAGDDTYERLMALPLWDEYGKMLESDIADLRNIGGRVGGMITAAKFLQHFTDYPWMHIDIAGPAFLDNKEGYRSKGATGVGVRLIERFVARMYQ